MAAIAWKSGMEVVVAASSTTSNWKTTSLLCGSSCPATLELVSRLLDCVEAERESLSSPWAVCRCSAACREAVVRCLAESKSLPEEIAEQLGAMVMIWELCEVWVLDDDRRSPSRAGTIEWLRTHCVDRVAEADECDKLMGLFRQIARRHGAPEAWQADGPESSSPFWQLAFRLARRGLGVEAWRVLELHSTRERLREAWAPVASLLREMPQPPRGASFEDPEARDAAAAAYEDSRRRWSRRAGRVRAAALRGDAALVSTVPPLRALLALLHAGPDEAGDAAEDADADAAESRLLQRLLYDAEVDTRAAVAEAIQASPAIDPAAAARRELLKSCLATGRGAACASALYALGLDVSGFAAAAVVARLCAAAGKLALAPPTRPGRGDLDAIGLARRLAVDVADRLECSGGWREALRALRALAIDDDEEEAEDSFAVAAAAVLRRAKPRDDADCLELARACLGLGARPEARASLQSRGSTYLDAGDAESAAVWFARAELASDRCAVDGPLDRLCRRVTTDLLADATASDAGALNRAREVASGVARVVAGDEPREDFFLGSSADVLGRLVALLDATDPDEIARRLRDLLLRRPPTDRSHLAQLIALLARYLPNDRLSPRDVLGFLHRLFESANSALDYGPRLSPKDLADLRYRLALALADAAVRQNRARRPSPPPAAAHPPLAFSRAAADLLDDASLDVC